jgi:transcriptional regulator with XRE-family HTH domain
MKDRLRQLPALMGLSVRAFAKKAGLSASFLRMNCNSVRTESLEKIFRAFPEVNTNWVLSGVGEPILAEPIDSKEVNDVDYTMSPSISKEYAKYTRAMQHEIDQLRATVLSQMSKIQKLTIENAQLKVALETYKQCENQ